MKSSFSLNCNIITNQRYVIQWSRTATNRTTLELKLKSVINCNPVNNLPIAPPLQNKVPKPKQKTTKH